MKMALVNIFILTLLTIADASLNGRVVLPEAWDMSCIPKAQSWLQKTCEWDGPPFISLYTTGGITGCSDLCEKTDLCVSGRYDMWTGLCELSQENCRLVGRNYPHFYLAAFVRVVSDPPIPQDDCFIVRKERAVYDRSRDGTQSFVQCRPGEVVTECDCERGVRMLAPPEGSCTGITISHSGTRCNAWGGAGKRGWAPVAVASCGRLLSGGVTVTSYPETGFSSEPSVQCPNPDTDLLFGCYVNTDGAVEGFEVDSLTVLTQGVREGSTCRAHPGCTACQVTAVCAPGTYPGKWHSPSSGYCLCANVLYGPWQTEANAYSRVDCSDGEVLTSCECETEDGKMCNGALVNPSQWRPPLFCWAFNTVEGLKIRAKACCAKVGGTMRSVWDPPLSSWSDSIINDPSSMIGKLYPRAICDEGFIVIGCTIFNPDGSYVETFNSGDWSEEEEIHNVCTTYSGRCTNCVASAICFKRGSCEGTAAEYGEVGPWSECESSYDGQAYQSRKNYCDSPTVKNFKHGGSCGPGYSYERRSCEPPPSFQPYLLVGIRGGIDRVDFNGTITRIIRVPNSHSSVENIAYDFHAGYIFYIANILLESVSIPGETMPTSTLRRCSLSGEDDTVLASHVHPKLWKLTIDTSALEIWFSRNQMIERSDYNGENRRVIHDRTGWFIKGLAFHAKYDREASKWERRIFWHEVKSGEERIMSSIYTGGDIQTLIPSQSYPGGWQSTLVSLSGSSLYWFKQRELHVVDIYTEVDQTLGAIDKTPIYLLAHEEQLYLVARAVMKLKLTAPGQIDLETVTSDLASPASMALVHENQIPSNGRWSDWEPWSECSWPCDFTGERARRRYCDNPPLLKHDLGDGCEGWDHALESCRNGPCEGPRISWSEAAERERMAVCRLYVSDESLVAVDSEFPDDKEHAETLISCATECTNRGLTCTQSLRVYPYAGGKGWQQVKKMPCTTKWSTLCCCT